MCVSLALAFYRRRHGLKPSLWCKRYWKKKGLYTIITPTCKWYLSMASATHCIEPIQKVLLPIESLIIYELHGYILIKKNIWKLVIFKLTSKGEEVLYIYTTAGCLKDAGKQIPCLNRQRTYLHKFNLSNQQHLIIKCDM